MARSALPIVALVAIAVLLIVPGNGVVTPVPLGLGSPTGAHPPDAASSTLAEARASLEAGLGPGSPVTLSCVGAASSQGRCPSPSPLPGTTPNSTWAEAPVAPFSRLDNYFVYDSSDGYLLSFGGIVSNDYIQRWNYVNETWSFQGGVWTNRTATAGPAPPFGQGQVMIDDPTDGYVLLFTTNNQTWTFHTGQWTRLFPTLTPGTLFFESAAYDAYDGYVLLFGGTSGARVTWMFHGGNWTSNSTGVQPWGRWEANMAFDVATNQSILWGGWDYRSGGQVLGTDTWAYRSGLWVQVNTTSSWAAIAASSPSVYDPASGSVLSFVSDCSGYSASIYAYANANWSLQQGCVLPDIYGVAYDPALSSPVAFAGAESYGATSSTWATLWEEGNGSWIQFYTPPFLPPPATNINLVADPTTNSLLYYSGSTYVFNGVSWSGSSSVTTPSGSSCSQGQLTYDAQDGYPLLFCNELWKYQNGNWSQIVQGIAGSWPDFRWDAGFAYDSADGVVILFGGGSGGYENDTWTYTGGTWTNITASAGAPPAGRFEPTLLDDPSDGYLLLFGGYSQSGATGSVTPLNDTWSFSGLTWTPLTPAHSPSAREGMMAAADVVDRGVLAFGGDAIQIHGGSWTDAFQNDTWLFSAGQWTNVSGSLRSAPDSRLGGAMAAVPGTQQIVLLGGYGDPWRLMINAWLWGTPAIPGPPTVQSFSASRPATDVGIASTLTVSVAGGSLPLTFNYTGLPPGCATVDVPRVGCTPIANGTFHIVAHVVDAQGRSTSSGLDLVVNPALRIAQFSETPAASVSLGSPIDLAVTTSGGTAPLRYVYAGLPIGCASANSPVLICTPTALGNYTVQATVSDALVTQSRASVSVSIVLPSGRPQLDVVSFLAEPPVVVQGSNLTLATAVQGGNGSLAYQYAGLPPGCVSQNAPAWVCAPTAVGNYSLTVVVTDQTPASAFAMTSVTVVAPPPGSNTSNTSNRSAAPPLQIQSFLPQHPSVVLGAPVQLTVVIVGGTPPWSISYGGLPPGCSSQNRSVLNCTPTEIGVFLTTISVIDVGGQHTQAEAIYEVLTPPSGPHPPTGATNSTATPAPPFAWPALAAGLVGGLLAGGCIAVVLSRTRRPPARPPASVL